MNELISFIIYSIIFISLGIIGYGLMFLGDPVVNPTANLFKRVFVIGFMIPAMLAIGFVLISKMLGGLL